MSAIRIPINLSNEPFRKDRALVVGSGVTLGLLVLLLLMLVTIIIRQRSAASESREMLSRIETQLISLRSRQSSLEAELRKPANAEVLERSVFLNTLLQRKGISWTQLFGDLETVFPGTVRLVAIRPYVTNQNHVQLEMVVGAQDPKPVIELLTKMESSPLFGHVNLLNSQPPTQNEPLFRYRVSVNYAQKL